MSGRWLSCLLLLADSGYGVGSGRIAGGWGYVWAAYGISWAAVTLYALSLWVRRPQTPLNKDSK